MMTDDKLQALSDEFRNNLETHNWRFDAPGFIKRVQESTAPDEADAVRDELLAVWWTWYLQWTIGNSPAFDP